MVLQRQSKGMDGDESENGGAANEVGNGKTAS